MHQQGSPPVQRNHGEVIQQFAASAVAETATHEEVAVAVHDMQCRTGRSQLRERIDNGRVRRGIVVVAEPVFEQIPKYVNRLCVVRGPLEQGIKEIEFPGPFLAQMQVRDEQGRHGCVILMGDAYPATTSTFSITTSWSGTSCMPPCLPVGTSAILLMTSCPSVTAPNTQ